MYWCISDFRTYTEPGPEKPDGACWTLHYLHIIRTMIVHSERLARRSELVWVTFRILSIAPVERVRSRGPTPTCNVGPSKTSMNSKKIWESVYSITVSSLAKINIQMSNDFVCLCRNSVYRNYVWLITSVYMYLSWLPMPRGAFSVVKRCVSLTSGLQYAVKIINKKRLTARGKLVMRLF